MVELCFIWNVPAKYETSTRDGQYVVSPRAGGRYFIAGTVIGILQNRDEELPDKQKVVLSDWVFRQNQIGVTPELTSTILEWSASAEIQATLERAHGLLLSMGLETTFIGEKLGWFRNLGLLDITLSDIAYAASSSTKSDEILYLARYLFEEGMISDWGHVLGFQVEPKGFQFLESKGIFNAQNKQVFVAMWFAEEMDFAYQVGIREAVTDCGYVPFRIDEKHHNNKIDDEIISEIRKSRFIIVDFTSGRTKDGTLIARGGVYYEAGFAQGLGIPVIWTCREDCISDVHFDTRQYNHIVWKDHADLKKKLASRISATIT